MHQSKVTPKHDYPVQPVPFTSVHLNDVFWAPRIETNRTATIPAAFKQCELTRTCRYLRPGGESAQGRAAREPQSAGLPVRRHRRLQGDRRRVVHAQRQPRPQARCLRGRSDREDCRGAGEGRISLHHANDQPAEPASLGRYGTLGARTRRQPRAVQPRPPVRGRRRALPGDRQAHAARRRDSSRRPARRRRSARASAASGPAIRSPRWAWSRCIG